MSVKPAVDDVSVLAYAGGDPLTSLDPQRSIHTPDQALPSAPIEFVEMPPAHIGHPLDIRIPPPHRAYDIALWCAAALKEPKYNQNRRDAYAYVSKTGRFLKARADCWRVIDLEALVQECRERFRSILVHWAAAWLLWEPKKSAPKRLQRGVAEGWWDTREFAAGLKAGLKRLWQKPPAMKIPFHGAIVEVHTPDAVPGDNYTLWQFDPSTDYHTAASGVRFSPQLLSIDTQEPFLCLVRQWFPDRHEAEYLQRLLGQALIQRSHRRYVVINAPANSGKNLFEACLVGALGSLVCRVGPRTFDTSTPHSDGLTTLVEQQPRLAVIGECQSARVDADLINALTGGDMIITRRAYDRKDTRDTLKCVPLFLGEAPPKLAAATSGTSERQTVFHMHPPTGKRLEPETIDEVKDPDHPIARACAGWLVLGALWATRQEDVGEAPASVLTASSEALAEQNPLLAWLLSRDWEHWENANKLAEDYCKETGEVVSAIAIGRQCARFSKQIERRLSAGVTQYHRKKSCNGGDWWR